MIELSSFQRWALKKNGAARQSSMTAGAERRPSDSLRLTLTLLK
jgi:hypothetical protein